MLGMTSENNSMWNKEDFELYMGAGLDCFGEDRLMYGANWPVGLLLGDYTVYYEMALEFAKG